MSEVVAIEHPRFKLAVRDIFLRRIVADCMTHACRLRKHEVIWPDGPPHARLGHCGATADFQATAEPPQKGERPQLRVLDGGRSMSKPGTS